MLHVLRRDRDERWSLPELEAEAPDVAPLALKDALERLERHGLIVHGDEWVLASRAALHLDALDMVSI
jgi:DNA-binding HxlR family transcriptional regulator